MVDKLQPKSETKIFWDYLTLGESRSYFILWLIAIFIALPLSLYLAIFLQAQNFYVFSLLITFYSIIAIWGWYVRLNNLREAFYMQEASKELIVRLDNLFL